MKKEIPLAKVYTLLESGPVILVSTAGESHPNVMPVSWHTMIDFDPPLVGCVIGEGSLTFRTIQARKECVISIPTAAIGPKVVACGGVSGAKTDKFTKFSLTPEKASRVKAPLIKECYASLECRLADASMAKKYNLFIFRVLKAWADPSAKTPRTIHHLGKDSFMVAGPRVSIKPGKGKK
jgi:flavin reductase (DIM6/NTAB) family NADH-FMN oxidoreductase RutF